MPSSVLFGINNEGRVHTLSTTGSMWRELPYVGQEFKKLSGVPHYLWGLGGDHQIYVYVHGLDIPIRVCEESYENERWLPIEGFSARLLPTDRYHYSSADGTVDRSIDKITLPSMAWQWEHKWKVELTLDGKPLDHDGWTYAVDFPSQYHPKKQWKSCVRRRLWTRSRRYSAMNSWCAIAPLHQDATSEPFIDVSIGGQNVPGSIPGTMLVWAVTSHNRVMFRTGVSDKSPEGARWNHIQTPVGGEVCQINVGATGLVWAALLDGRALVRTGVTRDNLQGENWIEVRAPGDNLRLIQITVGLCSVWAVTHDKQVWFRKGIKGEQAGVSEEKAAGCGWVEMVGRMAQISVTCNDQVFAVGVDDRLVYNRTGVCPEDLTGKRWKALNAPLQVSRASSNASLNRDKFHRSLNTLQSRPSSMIEHSNITDLEEQSHSAPLGPTSLPSGDLTKYETQPRHPKTWSPVQSVGSIVGMEVHPETDESVWSESSKDSCVFADDEELGWAEYEAPWSWVEAGACFIDTSQLPNWFPESGFSNSQMELDKPWRVKILNELKSRMLTINSYAHYQHAVDTTSWVHSGEAKVSIGNRPFMECILQLEWVQINGALTILKPDGATTMSSFSLSDVNCVQLCSEPGHPRLAIHVSRNHPSLIKLQFSSDTQLEEWQAHLATTCGKIHNVIEKPNEESVWAVSTLGDVFIWDPTEIEAYQLREDESYMQKYDLSAKISPFTMKLHMGCIPGTIITITGTVRPDAERIGINLEGESTYKNRHKAHTELKNVCFHFNPRFSDDHVVRNALIDGKWGSEETSGGMPFQKGQDFKMCIETTEDAFVVYIDDNKFSSFRHRMPPNSASYFNFWGKMKVFKLVIRSPQIILNPMDMYWRQIGGHFKRVETCKVGVTWAIGCDQTCWVYNGGWGGGFLGTMDTYNVNSMADCQNFKLYENQRWNPLTGYTSTGLPTDRHMWSDSTGKKKRTKEQVKLPTMRWQWLSDWMVDYHVPGGVDGEGWQYAVDFPANFHKNKQFTDYVRRRRWYRKCEISTTGPWVELGHTKLLDICLEPIYSDLADSVVALWALATGGQAMVRLGVTKSNPMGHGWEHVTSDQALCSISCGPFDSVWAIGKKGCAFYRAGITEDKLEGEQWVSVEPPNGVHLKQISVNSIGIWAIDQKDRLYVTKATNRDKPQWQIIEMDPPVLNAAPNTTGFKHVSVGKKEVWVTTNSGLMVRRLGICASNPAGLGWETEISGEWQQVSVRAFN